jgi:caa(3)-type oxidase subunit IV
MSASHDPHSDAAGASHDEHPFDFDLTVRKYLKVGAVLIAGTFITVMVAFIPWLNTGIHWVDMTIGLLIAATKVSFVCLIFMHLNHERGLIYKLLLFSMIFFIAMMFLFCLAYLDPIAQAIRRD